MDREQTRLDAARQPATAVEDRRRGAGLSAGKDRHPTLALPVTFEDDGAFYFSTELVPGVSM